ncbi:MAG TPA: apolipoprotein N-acyltransferase, partial [Aestuariivirga sp.]|nr:apolipoprotein N-acyltransferase [Aestuariivirga sp.]
MIEFLRAARGWRRAGLALSAGMIAALSMPPHDLWPLLFIAIPVVLFMLEGKEREERLPSFFLGWCFGFGYFIVALHWIGFAFLVDAEAYLWMMPFAVGGLAAGMAVYWGLATFCVALSRREGLPVALVFAVSLAAFEYLRGVLFTGFPWAAPGLASDGMGAVAQTASLWGMPALTLLIVLWAATWPFMW